MGKIVSGWILILLSYLTTYLLAVSLYLLIFKRNIDYDWDQSGLFIGAFLATIPYVSAGIFVRKWLNASVKHAFWISIVPILTERLFLISLGIAIVNEPSVTNSVWLAIRGEFAPYFTPLYLATGLLSLLICIAVGKKDPIKYKTL